MNRTQKTLGWVLVGVGVLIVIFSGSIVFPGLERLLGVKTIVGSENVYYQPDGSYIYTNPEAMARWIFCAAGVGFLVAAGGGVMIWAARCNMPSESQRQAK